MAKIAPSETVLTGQWISENGKVTDDPICKRVQDLALHYLKRLAVSNDGWETLYLDPEDGRLWEHTYPQSHMHGGGPPELHVIPLETAKVKYSIDTVTHVLLASES